MSAFDPPMVVHPPHSLTPEELDATCREHWRQVRLGLVPAPDPHEYRDDGPEVIRNRAAGLISGAVKLLREANDLLAKAAEMDRWPS